MKTKEISNKSDKELEKLINQTREKIAGFKRDRYMTDERNVRQARSLRRDLARMLTEANQRAASGASDEKEDK